MSVTDRPLLAADAIGRDAERHEAVHGRPGTPIAEREVVFDGAALVALSLDEDQRVVGLEPGRIGLQCGCVTGPDVVPVEVMGREATSSGGGQSRHSL